MLIMLKKYRKFLWYTMRNPSIFFANLIAIFRGCFYIIWYKVTKRKVTIRFPFLCHDKVEICGPGKVIINSHCTVWMNSFEHLVIKTLSQEAEVRIGKNCTLGGLTIRCCGQVNIGDNVMTAANLIQDVPITNKSIYNTKQIETKSITIENDVWLAGQSIILGQSSVGNGSVLGLNALLYNSSVANNCFSSGNPAMRSIPIAKLNKMRPKDKI